MSACDLLASDDEEELQPGEFTAEVTGDTRESVQGTAFFEVAGMGNERTSRLRLKSGEYRFRPEGEVVELGIFLESRRSMLSEPGTYSIGGGVSDQDADFVGSTQLRLPVNPVGTAPVFFMEQRGTLEVTNVEDGRVRGTFDLEAITSFPIAGLDANGGAVNVRGAFIAERAQ